MPPDLKRQVEGILGDPNFLSVSDVAAATVQFSDARHFTFRSPRVVSAAANNNVVHGKYFPAARNSVGTVLLIHGWNAEYHYTYGLPWVAHHLNKAGLDGLMIELPFHSHRRPRAADIPANFISEDIPLMLRLVEQSLADFQAALLWAEQKSGGPVAVWGFSLGAWLAGLFCTESKAAAAAVLTTPVVRMDLTIEQLEFCEPIRRAMKDTPLELGSLNLAERQPRTEASRVLVVESVYDEFVPRETIHDMTEAWGGVETWSVPHGHISILCSGKVSLRTARWLREKLG